MTTMIRLDDDLTARVTLLAKRSGKSAHAFIVDTIVQTVEQADVEAAFHRVADARCADFLETGKSVPWDDAKTWVDARLRGETPPKPRARKLGR